MKINMSESACLALEGARAMFGILLGTTDINPLAFTEVRMWLLHNLEHSKNGAYRNFRFTCKVIRGNDCYEQAKADVSVIRKDGRWHFYGGGWDHSAKLSKQHTKVYFRWKSKERNWFERPECTMTQKHPAIRVMLEIPIEYDSKLLIGPMPEERAYEWLKANGFEYRYEEESETQGWHLKSELAPYNNHAHLPNSIYPIQRGKGGIRVKTISGSIDKLGMCAGDGFVHKKGN